MNFLRTMIMILFGYKIIKVLEFPPGYKMLFRKGKIGVINEQSKTPLVIPTQYQKILYDSSGDRFVASMGDTTYLLDPKGRKIFQTAECKIPGFNIITQKITPIGDGTYKYTSSNHMAQNGWEVIISKDGKHLSEMKHFELQS